MNAFKSNPAFAINLDPGLQAWKLAGAGPDLGTHLVAARTAYSDAQENRAPIFKVNAGGDRFGDAISTRRSRKIAGRKRNRVCSSVYLFRDPVSRTPDRYIALI
ncbi:MAG: hypothetical protein U1E30_10320 [Rhodoblastus sp.]